MNDRVNPVVAVYLVRVTLRLDENGAAKPPTNLEINEAIENHRIFDEFDVNADAERVDQ